MQPAGTNKLKNDRRGFLSDTWFWIKAAALTSLALPIYKFFDFSIPKKPLFIKVHRALKKNGFILEHNFIIFDDPQAPRAVSRICTHLGCRLNYNEIEQLLICPCHQSKFTMAGKRVAGPARRDLPVYPVSKLPESEGDGFLVVI